MEHWLGYFNAAAIVFGAGGAVALAPGMIVVSDLAVTARSADVDFWGFVAINLNR